MIAVFEPRTWSSRLAIFQEPYAKAFSYADYVIIAGVYNTSKASELGKVLDVNELVADIAQQGKPVLSFPDADTIVEHLAPEMRDGDVVAIMSNGGFGGIHEKLLNIRARAKSFFFFRVCFIKFVFFFCRYAFFNTEWWRKPFLLSLIIVSGANGLRTDSPKEAIFFWRY